MNQYGLKEGQLRVTLEDHLGHEQIFTLGVTDALTIPCYAERERRSEEDAAGWDEVLREIGL